LEDFGFRFKEGNDETGWDDQHNILTFRYTEPMTWWMGCPRACRGRSMRRWQRRGGWPTRRTIRRQGVALQRYHDENGQFAR